MEERNQKTGKKQKQPLNAYAKYSGLGFQMIAVFLAAAFAGTRLDAYFKFDIPAMTIICLLSAVAVSMVILVKGIPKE